MPFIGGESVDKKLQELRERQASKRSEVTAANKREEVKLTAFLDKLDSKHDKDMVSLNTKLHVTKIDLVREIQKETSPKLLQQVQKASKYFDSKAHSNFQPKNKKFGAMKIPSQHIRQRHNVSPISKVYPFHLITAESVEVSKISKKKQLPAISPRQFPILSAKYYREKQAKTVKADKMQMKSHENVLENETIQKLVKGIRDTSPKRKGAIAVENSLLPPVSMPSYASLGHTLQPSNSPRNRLTLTDMPLHGKTKTSDPSDEDLQRLRNGQYFLRYSTALDNNANHYEGKEVESDVAPSENDAVTQATPCPPSPRGKSRLDNVLTLIEDYNKPTQT